MHAISLAAHQVPPPTPPCGCERAIGRKRVAAWLVAGAIALAAWQARAEAAAPAASEQAFLAANDAAMKRMMADMTIKPTGDVDRDFVAMMVPHHQGAIAMAQAELLYGHNQQLLRICQEIVVEQSQEIAAMHVAVGDRVSAGEAALAGQVAGTREAAGQPAEHPVGQPAEHSAGEAAEGPAGETAFLHENDTAMDRMMADMTIKPTGDIDRDFVAMMVPHHQGAIDMAQAELRHGHNASLRRIAQEIIVGQAQEITLMRLAVNEPLPPSAASPTNPGPAAGADGDDHGRGAMPMTMPMAPQATPAK